MDSPADVDTQDFVNAINTVADALTKGALGAEQAIAAITALVTMMLSDLGVDDASTLLEPTAPEQEGALSLINDLVEIARGNYEAGNIRADQVVEFVLGLLVEGKGQ